MIALLALYVLQEPLAHDPMVRVLARDQEGFGEAAVVSAERPWPVPIPLVARSPLVQRIVPRSDGLGLRIEGVSSEKAVTVTAASHPVDHQVLVCDGTLILVGPPRLPRDAGARTAAGGILFGLLPELARLDGASADGTRGLLCPRPDGAGDGSSDLELFALATASPRVAWRGSGGEVRAGTAAEIDQVFYAQAEPLEHPVALALRSSTPVEGGLELLYQAPERGAQGTTWTVIVAIDLTQASPAARPVPAAAGPRSEGFLVDRARELGLAMVHFEGPDEQLDIRPTMGPGAAWGDFDLDGRADLYLVQGSGREGSVRPANRLYRQVDGGFADVTARCGGGDEGAGMGALFFDANGDGDLDLYVANYGPDVLYENRDAKRLVDASASAGIGGDDIWSAGVAASDADHDGDLDLYVTGYLVYDTSLIPPAAELARYSREDPVEMLPFAFPGARNTFLRNESGPNGLRFTDATEELGLADEAGRGMQAVFWDFDRDGDDDLYVANDASYDVLMRNDGGRFKDISFAAGMDDPRGGMGLAVGDVELDGDEDLFLTHWELELNALYINNLVAHQSQKHHVAAFRDSIVPAGLAPSSATVTSWGAEFFDAENDGDLDLFIANGYTSPDYESTGICIGQPSHFFESAGDGRFTDASVKSGASLGPRLPSRCAIGCDFDQDGDVDLALTANNAPFRLLRNELPPAAKGHWLLVRLRGRGGNTYAIGAEVTLESEGRLQRRTLRAGTSYLGGNPPELHLGLGKSAAPPKIVVRWPSGARSTHTIDGVDRVVVLSQPE